MYLEKKSIDFNFDKKNNIIDGEGPKVINKFIIEQWENKIDSAFIQWLFWDTYKAQSIKYRIEWN